MGTTCARRPQQAIFQHLTKEERLMSGIPAKIIFQLSSLNKGLSVIINQGLIL